MVNIYGKFVDITDMTSPVHENPVIFSFNEITGNFLDSGQIPDWTGNSWWTTVGYDQIETNSCDWPATFFSSADALHIGYAGNIIRFYRDSACKKPMAMWLKCMKKDSDTRYSFVLGDLKHGQGIRFFGYKGSTTFPHVCMFMNPSLSAAHPTSIDDIDDYLKNEFEDYLSRGEYDYTILRTGENQPIAPYEDFADNQYYRWHNTYNTWPDFVNSVEGLLYYPHWHLMFYDQHVNRNAPGLKLDNPIKGVERIEMAMPVCYTIVDEGKDTTTTRNDVPNVEKTFTYFDLGTDLTYLFGTARPNQQMSIAAGGARLILDRERFKNASGVEFGSPSTTITLKYRSNYYLKFYINYETTSLSYDQPGSTYFGNFFASGIYLMCSPNYIGTPVSSWATKLTSTSSDEIDNCPFTFTTLMIGYNTQFAANDYWGTQNGGVLPWPVLPQNYAGNPSIQDSNTYADTFIAFAARNNNFNYEAWHSLLTGIATDKMFTTYIPGGGDITSGNGGPHSKGGAGNSDTNPGNANYDNTGNDIDLPTDVPDLADMGSMSSTYMLNSSQLEGLGNSLATVTNRDWAGVSKMESIISLNAFMTPDKRTPSSHTANVVAGGLTLLNNVLKCDSSVISFTTDSVEVPEYFGSFLDYEPYTAIEIYLPFIGMKPIDASEIVGGSFRLIIKQNIVAGTVTYVMQITKGGYTSSRYSWTGDCTIPIPVSSTNYAAACQAIKNGLMQVGGGAISMVAGAFTGNAAAVGAGAAAVFNGAWDAHYASSKTHVEHTSGLSGVGGAYACMRPFLSITRPKMSLPASYVQDKGFPSNISVNLGSLTGYAEIDTIHLQLAGATKKEKEKIVELLKTGTIF